MSRMRWPWLLFILLPALLRPAGAAVVFSDNFNDNVLDTTIWKVETLRDLVANEISQRLEVTGTDGELAVYIRFPIGGDFEVVVDYSILRLVGESDAGGLCLFGLTPGSEGPCIGRTPTAYGFVDPAPDPDEWWPMPTSDTEGRFRLSRVGSTLSGYYWAGTDWQLVHSLPANTGAWLVGLGFNYDSPAGIAFDNFSLTADYAVPEPGSWTLVCAGLLTVVCTRRLNR